MTQQYAVVDNQEFNGRSKFATDYVFVGNGKAAQAEVARVKGKEDNQGVTIYKVTVDLEFTDQAELDIKNNAQNVLASGKETVLGLAAKWGLPTTKTEAGAKVQELKVQALQEASETGAQLAGGLIAAYKLGQKDPKKLADTAKKGLMAKFQEVKTRGTEFAQGVAADARTVEGDVKSDAKATVSKVIDQVVGPEPMAVRTDEGKTFVRMAFLATAGHATQIKESTLASHVKKPGARKVGPK
jgi:hypothetical protein